MRVTLTYYLFDFLMGRGASSSFPLFLNTYPFPFTRSYFLQCSQHLTNLLRLAYVLFTVTVWFSGFAGLPSG